ncbi:hypothetical protein [Streptomyces sp. NPDC088915]|uniref:hypothetical protein n=1 Tax=Streptomyces sp. NPDC088915 TaxID=3365912 RepID=UPI00380C2F25
MSAKRLALSAALVVAVGAVLAFALWPRDEKPAPPRSLCFGTVGERTAALLDDGPGGRIDMDEFERKGEGGFAFFRSCIARRDNPGGDGTRTTYSIVMQDAKSAVGRPKGSVPLGDGFTGWVLRDRAEAQLPAGCAAKAGSTAPHVTVELDVPFQAEKRNVVDRETAVRNSSTVLREVVTNLARNLGC